MNEEIKRAILEKIKAYHRIMLFRHIRMDGDCVGASFLYCFLKNGDIDGAIRFATERSNVVVSNTEAIPQAFVDAARGR